MLALGGVASIVFGALPVAFPGYGLITLVWLVGIWSVVFAHIKTPVPVFFEVSRGSTAPSPRR